MHHCVPDVQPTRSSNRFVPAMSSAHAFGREKEFDAALSELIANTMQVVRTDSIARRQACSQLARHRAYYPGLCTLFMNSTRCRVQSVASDCCFSDRLLRLLVQEVKKPLSVLQHRILALVLVRNEEVGGSSTLSSTRFQRAYVIFGSRRSSLLTIKQGVDEPSDCSSSL